MARICHRCNRPLDAEHHDVDRYPDDHKDAALRGQPRKRIILASRGRGRFGIRKVMVYGCRVRLVADSPTTGRRLAPASPQRERHTGLARYTYVDRLREEH